MVTRENILLHMTVEERHYMKKIVLALKGKIVRNGMPEKKREALLAYRAQSNKLCDNCISEIAAQEMEKNAKVPFYQESAVAPRKKAVKRDKNGGFSNGSGI